MDRVLEQASVVLHGEAQRQDNCELLMLLMLNLLPICAMIDLVLSFYVRCGGARFPVKPSRP